MPRTFFALSLTASIAGKRMTSKTPMIEIVKTIPTNVKDLPLLLPFSALPKKS
jgi:hypothetical protein